MKNNIIKTICLLGITFLFVSCSNIFSFVKYDAHYEEITEGMSSVSVAVQDLVSKSAMPSALPSGATNYFATISYSNSGTKYLGTSGNALSSPEYLQNSGTVTNPKYMFVTPSFSGTYTISLFLCTSSSYSENSCVAKGSVNFILNAGQRSYLNELLIPMKGIVTSSGQGSVDIKLTWSFDQDPEIKIYNSDGIDNTSLLGDNSAAKTFKINKVGAKSGTYYINIKMPDDSRMQVENPIQTFTIFDGLKTDAWFIDGENKGNGIVLTLASQNTFYVCGNNPEVYGKTYGVSSVNIGNDSNDGSLLKPFKTVSKAIEKIIEINNSFETYKIYVDGTTEETNTINVTETTDVLNVQIEAFLDSATIKGSSSLSDSIFKIEGSSTNLTVKKIIIDGNSDYRNNFARTGGGFNIVSGYVELQKCTVQNCKTDNSGNGGGAVIRNGATLYLKDSVLKNNAAASGEGIFNNGILKIIGSTVIEDDVKLTRDGYITITGKLTPPSDTSVATINPDTSSVGLKVINISTPLESATSLQEEVGKFHLKNSSYFIDKEGKLASTNFDAGDGNPATVFPALLETIPQGQEVTINIPSTISLSGMSNPISINEGQEVILKLSSGNSITCSSYTVFNVNGGKLTIETEADESTITAGTSSLACITVTKGELIIKNKVTIKSTGVGIELIDGKLVLEDGVKISNCGSNAIIVNNGEITVGNATIENSKGIVLKSGKGTFTKTTFSKNSSKPKGGALYITGGDFEFNTCSIVDNTVTCSSTEASYGGGVCIEMEDANKEVKINGCNINGNEASASGSGGSANGGGIAIIKGKVIGENIFSSNSLDAQYSATANGIQIYCGNDGYYNGIKANVD